MNISPISISLLMSALLLVGCSSSTIEIGQKKIVVSDKQETRFEGARISPGNPWWELDQGWNPETRKAFWFTPQGSQMIPYGWFLHLKNGSDSDYFKNDMAQYGYVPAPEDPAFNPDRLPIGFARMPITLPQDGSPGVEWLGPTCSACHSNRMILKTPQGARVPVLVDGAPSLADFTRMVDDLNDALSKTHNDPKRFERFADAVLADRNDPARRDSLKKDVFGRVIKLANFLEGLSYVGKTQEYVTSKRQAATNAAPDPHTKHGHGRIDAVGAILNQVADEFIGLGKANFVAPLAPVSYPFLWGTPQSAVVQWNGFAPNGLLGAGGLARNVGEVLGVFGCVEIPSKSTSPSESESCDPIREGEPTFGYASSIHISNLGHIEKWVGGLRSPAWPSNILGGLKSDEKAEAEFARGEAVYANLCKSCHALVKREDQGKSYQPVMVSVSIIGTDPRMADNFLLQRNQVTAKPWSSGNLKGERSIPLPFIGAAIGPKYEDTMTTRAQALTTVAAGVILSKPATSIGAALTGRDYDGDALPDSTDKRSYKARPLTGIWATAPYLHNGSVASLAELLTPAEDRLPSFEVGNPEFDPKNVGYVTEKVDGVPSSKFDTKIPGNSNAGHTGAPFGTTLTKEDKAALIRYLKSL